MKRKFRPVQLFIQNARCKNGLHYLTIIRRSKKRAVYFCMCLFDQHGTNTSRAGLPALRVQTVREFKDHFHQRADLRQRFFSHWSIDVPVEAISVVEFSLDHL